MLKNLSFVMLGVTAVIFCGCQADRLTSAPGGIEVSPEKYAAEYWQEIAKPVPVFEKTLIDKTEKESAEIFERYTALFKKYAPYLLEEYQTYDKVLKWKPGTYLKRTFWPLDGEAMAKQKGHECTSWAALPDLAAENQLLLHKSRDTSIRKSVIVHRPAKERYGYIGLHDIGWADVTMGINSVGVAITMNSGDLSDGVSDCGMDTTLLGRIILEQCKTADEAAAMLKDMFENDAYKHGICGSIFMIADKDCVYIVENDGKRYHSKKYTKGFAIRANAWSFPEMLPFSQKKFRYVLDSRRREFAVTEAVFERGKKYDRPVTAEQMIKAARVTKVEDDIDPKANGPCAARTVSAATFSIDREFPADLTVIYAAVGNPEYTFFIPIPLTVNEVPAALLNQKFSEEVYRNFAKKQKNVSDAKRDEIEKRMYEIQRIAREKARKILRNSFSESCRLEARKIMNDAFAENWRIISKYYTNF